MTNLTFVILDLPLFLEREAYQFADPSRRIQKDGWRWTEELVVEVLPIWKGSRRQHWRRPPQPLPLALRSLPFVSPGWSLYYLKVFVCLRQIHLGDIKVPFGPLRNAREVRRVLVEHLNHSGFFQDIVQTKSRLYLELWKSHVGFYQPFLLFKMALDISCF